MKSCNLMLLVVILLGVVTLLSGVRRTAGLVGDGNGVSANDELPRGSGDEGTDMSRLGGIVAPCLWKTEETEVENDALGVVCIQAIQQ